MHGLQRPMHITQVSEESDVDNMSEQLIGPAHKSVKGCPSHSLSGPMSEHCEHTACNNASAAARQCSGSVRPVARVYWAKCSLFVGGPLICLGHVV